MSLDIGFSASDCLVVLSWGAVGCASEVRSRYWFCYLSARVTLKEARPPSRSSVGTETGRCPGPSRGPTGCCVPKGLSDGVPRRCGPEGSVPSEPLRDEASGRAAGLLAGFGRRRGVGLGKQLSETVRGAVIASKGVCKILTGFVLGGLSLR